MTIDAELLTLVATQVLGFGGVIYRLAKLEERMSVHIETLERHDARLSRLEAKRSAAA